MKAYIIEEGKGWKLLNLPEPTLNYGEVLIGVRANSINFRDWLIAMGRYRDSGKKDCVALSDGAGEILAVGDGVGEFKIGDRVVANFFETWETGPILPQYLNSALGGAADGMLAEKVVRKASGIVKIPEHLSYEEAATLPCAGVTAWNALMESNTPLKPGASVLTLGTGGVSLFAAQFAKAAGLRVISTSSSDQKLLHLQKMGVDLGINYKTHPDWENNILKHFTEGVDHIIEVGGDTLPHSFAALKLAGTISIIGFRAGMHEQISPMNILSKTVHLQGIFVGSVAMFKAMNKAIELHKIKPIISDIYDFGKANEALEQFAKGQHFGKVVIKM